ncbi:MAG: hypothetical protein ACTSVO_13625 [Candidatus Heimdallarchaeaceae archaeon]
MKIKPGYNPNCSSGMWALGYIFYGFIGAIALTAISGIIAFILHKKHIPKSESHETNKV